MHNLFLPVVNKDINIFCNACRGKECSADDHCSDCYDWSYKMWAEVSDYCVKLAVYACFIAQSIWPI